MHGLQDLRLVLTYNFYYFLCYFLYFIKIIDLFFINF